MLQMLLLMSDKAVDMLYVGVDERERDKSGSAAAMRA